MINRKILAVILFYGIIAIFCIIWDHFRNNLNIFLYSDPIINLKWYYNTVVSIIVGLALGFIITWFSRESVFRWNWAKYLHLQFKMILGPLSKNEIFVFAIMSGIVEEMAFRGLIQQETNIFIASLVFGLLHIGQKKNFFIWTIQAIIIGFVFGFTFMLTGNLLSAIIAHFYINYKNLHFIVNYKPYYSIQET